MRPLTPLHYPKHMYFCNPHQPISNLHLIIISFTATTTLLIQPLEPTPLLLQQSVWLAILHQTPLIHHNDFVKVENRVQFVRHSDDSVA
jgi:hypothetical protein